MHPIIDDRTVARRCSGPRHHAHIAAGAGQRSADSLAIGANLSPMIRSVDDRQIRTDGSPGRASAEGRAESMTDVVPSRGR
jgi:hypothetical protein